MASRGGAPTQIASYGNYGGAPHRSQGCGTYSFTTLHYDLGLRSANKLHYISGVTPAGNTGLTQHMRCLCAVGATTSRAVVPAFSNSGRQPNPSCQIRFYCFYVAAKNRLFLLFLCVDHCFLAPQLQFHSYTLYHQHAQIRLIAVVVGAAVIAVTLPALHKIRPASILHAVHDMECLMQIHRAYQMRQHASCGYGGRS